MGTNGNGATPEDLVEFEDSGPVRGALYASLAGNPNAPSAHDIAKALFEYGGGGPPGGGVPPDQHVKTVKRHNWITALLVLLFGSGGVFTTMKMTEAKADTNHESIEKLKKTNVEDFEPRIKANEESVRLIRVDINDVKEEISGDPLTGKAGIKQDVAKIADGIEALKKENQTRKQQELEEKSAEQAARILYLERELRRR